MTEQAFVDTVRAAQKQGVETIQAVLLAPYKGCRNVVIDISGNHNNNRHDLWLYSKGGSRVIGRAYTGSRKRGADLQGWPERIDSLSPVA